MKKLTLLNFSLPKIRSFISSEYVKPTEWIEEIKNCEYKYDEIIELIEVYEFIIASLIKAISYLLNLDHDQTLNDKINKIIENISYYTEKYFNFNPNYTSLFNIIQFHQMFINNYKYGVYSSKTIEEMLKKFIDSWNGYYFFVFGETENILEFDNKAAEERNLLIGKNEFSKLAECFSVPDINYDEIQNLFDFYSRLALKFKFLNNLHKKNAKIKTSIGLVIKFIGIRDKSKGASRKIIKIQNINNRRKDNAINLEIESQNISTKLLINIEKQLTENSILINDNITKTSVIIQSVIKKEAELTREQIKVSMDITNEILNAVKENKGFLENKCAEKIWMLARHPEFEKPLQILINKKQVIEKSYYFEWQNYKGLKDQPGYNLLAYFIYKNTNLSKNINQKGITAKQNFEPFSTGFNIEDLQTNFKKGKIPSKYNDFISELNIGSDIKLK
jgi:hypothetical protein